MAIPDDDPSEVVQEIADQLSPQARQELIAEAAERYRQDNWQERRRRFLTKLDLFERVWFGGI